MFWVTTHLRYLWAVWELWVSDHNILNYSGQDRNGEPVLICCQPGKETAPYKGLVISVTESTQVWCVSSEQLSAAGCPEECLNFRSVSAALCLGGAPAVLAPCSQAVCPAVSPQQPPAGDARCGAVQCCSSFLLPSQMHQETPQNDASRTNYHLWPRYNSVFVRTFWSGWAPVHSLYKVTMELLATSCPTDLVLSNR